MTANQTPYRINATELPAFEVTPPNGVDNIFVDFPPAQEIERRAIAADPDV